MQVDADEIVGFKFVGHCAVTYAGDHGCQAFALFHEVFRADWIVEPFTDSNIGEFDTSTKGRRGHKRKRIVEALNGIKSAERIVKAAAIKPQNRADVLRLVRER